MYNRLDRKKQDSMVKGYLDQIIEGLRGQGFGFDHREEIHGDQIYIHKDNDLYLKIIITGSFPREAEVDPVVWFEVGLTHPIFAGITATMGPVLSKVVQASGLNKIKCPSAAYIKPDSAAAVIACISQIKQKWTQLQPRLLGLIQKHMAEVKQIEDEIVLTDPIPVSS